MDSPASPNEQLLRLDKTTHDREHYRISVFHDDYVWLLLANSLNMRSSVLEYAYFLANPCKSIGLYRDEAKTTSKVVAPVFHQEQLSALPHLA